MAQHDDSDRQALLDALNALVQKGLVDVVSIAEDGEPSYRLASWIRDVNASPRRLIANVDRRRRLRR